MERLQVPLQEGAHPKATAISPGLAPAWGPAASLTYRLADVALPEVGRDVAPSESPHTPSGSLTPLALSAPAGVRDAEPLAR